MIKRRGKDQDWGTLPLKGRERQMTTSPGGLLKRSNSFRDHCCDPGVGQRECRSCLRQA